MSDRPKTVYELCERVCEAIELAPMHYLQKDWATPAKLHFGEEACGTAYCRAGWMHALGKTDCELTNVSSIVMYADTVLRDAGVDDKDINILFAGGAISWAGEPGTPAYVKAGIAGMRAFMTKYEASLKAAQLDANGDVIK